MADSVEIAITRGEDFSCQMFWTDQWNESVNISAPVEGTVRDSAGQQVLRFVDDADATIAPCVLWNTQGFFQLTIPASRTWALAAGVYGFDLWAGVVDSAPPFEGQRQQVISGIVRVSSPQTRYSAG